MGKIVFFNVLVMLLLVHGTVGSSLYDTFDIFGEIESLECEDDEIESSDSLSWASQHGSKILVNVDSFGAAGDGVTDDTKAVENAWSQACSTAKSVLLVPPGRTYLVNATRFKGPCAGKLIVQLDGTIVAPDEPKDWDPKSPRNWLQFSNISGATFQGRGVIDGSGKKWWAASCKKNKTNPCVGAPTAFTIEHSSAIKVKGLTFQNSQQMHFVISHCDSVRIYSVVVSAPEDSPNTDGIHLTGSTNVVIQNSKIGTGDDCISIVNASTNIKMKNIYCGPGHGIRKSGKDNSTGIVSKVVVDTAFLKGTTNGLRIKTWQGGSGYVKGVRYQNVKMEDVANPIIIDQFYCDSPKSCKNQVQLLSSSPDLTKIMELSKELSESFLHLKTSAVEISQIMYLNVTGSSKSAAAMKFACSDTVPCNNIVLNNINLQRLDGINYGFIQPSADCLTSSDKSYIEENELIDVEEDRLIHTEL
ncbi:hypothetical protein OSB04_018468 [Centaurea solstitialis]|uniref:endo-polygalacturonase n=1 Tax=Centaurea solstitialis TaxID=347529 RepID=A0AA38TPU5_9ASTR|nr:hypothetical protein OSB04_018468 [Centaurea solstitialis]